jgi:serine/threonine protein kinase/CRP-like cAMP-binding protein
VTTTTVEEERPSLTLGIDYGAYNARRVLGTGPFGTVYDAIHRPDGRPVALKVIHPHMVSEPAVLSRFAAAVSAGVALKHPHVVTVVDRGARGGVPYVAMELLPGEDLRNALTREGVLSVGAVADVFIPVLAALATAHARGVAHGDLKPENLFLVSPSVGPRVPKLLDFGVSSLRENLGPGLRRNVLSSAPQYLSPDQARQPERCDPASDLWAVGVMLYEAATGRLPFTGFELDDILDAIQRAPFPLPSAARRTVPAEFDTLIRRLLSRARSERTLDAEGVARALVPFAGGAGQRAWAALFGHGAAASARPLSATSSSAPPRMSATTSTAPPRIPSAAHPAAGAVPRIADDPRRYLQTVEALARLAPDDASALLSFIRWRALRAGEVLYREGTPGATMVLVVEGELGVYSEATGVRQELSRVGVGSFVGEMACLDPSPRSATVEATTPCVVGELSRDAVKTLQTVAPRAAAAVVGAVIRGVVQRIREVDARIDEALAPPPPDTPEPTAHATGSMQRLFDWLRRR